MMTTIMIINGKGEDFLVTCLALRHQRKYDKYPWILIRDSLVYALRTLESKKQYPRRLKVFLDFLYPEIEKVPFEEIEKTSEQILFPCN